MKIYRIYVYDRELNKFKTWLSNKRRPQCQPSFFDDLWISNVITVVFAAKPVR